MPQKSADVVSTNEEQLRQESHSCCAYSCLQPKGLLLLGEEHRHVHVKSW